MRGTATKPSCAYSRPLGPDISMPRPSGSKEEHLGSRLCSNRFLDAGEHTYTGSLSSHLNKKETPTPFLSESPRHINYIGSLSPISSVDSHLISLLHEAKDPLVQYCRTPSGSLDQEWQHQFYTTIFFKARSVNSSVSDIPKTPPRKKYHCNPPSSSKCKTLGPLEAQPPHVLVISTPVHVDWGIAIVEMIAVSSSLCLCVHEFGGKFSSMQPFCIIKTTMRL